MRTHQDLRRQRKASSDKKPTVKCRYCKKKNTMKKGFRRTKKKGKIQRYFCHDCSRSFTADTGFFRMRNSEKVITMSVDMYLSNLSSRKMRNQLKRHIHTKISHVSVLDWVRRYTLRVSKYIYKLQPKFGGKLYADETEIDCNKRKDIFWCSVDWDTRYINATLYSPNSQNMHDAKEFMQRIRKSIRLPKYIQTDALPFYPRAFKKAFYSRYKKLHVQHRINNVSKTGKHNVRIETVFSKIKDRVHDFRGLKALWSAPILLQGIVLQHNWIEPHTTTNRVPSELTGIKCHGGFNRWLTLIRASAT